MMHTRTSDVFPAKEINGLSAVSQGMGCRGSFLRQRHLYNNFWRGRGESGRSGRDGFQGGLLCGRRGNGAHLTCHTYLNRTINPLPFPLNTDNIRQLIPFSTFSTPHKIPKYSPQSRDTVVIPRCRWVKQSAQSNAIHSATKQSD